MDNKEILVFIKSMHGSIGHMKDVCVLNISDDMIINDLK